MPYPTLYVVTYSYSDFQESQGDNSFPGTQVDNDFAGLDASLASLASFMKTVIRSDGQLNNGIVTFDSLSPSLQTAGIMPATAWATGMAYPLNANVIEAFSLYRATVAHTSGDFGTDLAAGKWVLVLTLPAGRDGVDGIGYGGSSTTSLVIGTGSKVFATQAGLAYQVGGYVRASSAAGGANFMEGFVTDYVGTSMTIGVIKVGGAGTFADWNLQVAGAPGDGDLLSTNNLSDLADIRTARNNLGFPGVLRGFISGLITANNATTPASKVDVAAGVAVDDNQQAIMQFAAGTIDFSTVGANGLDAGAIAATKWYHLFAIGKADGTTAFLASLSATTPTLPSTYAYKRWIGAVLTDATPAIVAYSQVGNRFLWKTNRRDTTQHTINTTPFTLTLASAPTGVVCNALLTLGWFYSAASAYCLALTMDQVAQTPSTNNYNALVASALTQMVTNHSMRTSTLAQFIAVASAAITLDINVTGWEAIF
jgi:hypothetical protein